jgi:uncharacterized RDD family membrane protein YckC
MSDAIQPESTVYAQATGASGPRAGFWQRFGAYLLDILLLLVFEIVVLVILHKALGLAYVIVLVGSYAYFTILEGGPTGQTLGMRALGIRVIDFRAGGPIGYGRAFLRQIVKIISGAVFFLGYLWMLWDREKQCWHDKAANDVVVPIEAYPV